MAILIVTDSSIDTSLINTFTNQVIRQSSHRVNGMSEKGFWIVRLAGLKMWFLVKFCLLLFWPSYIILARIYWEAAALARISLARIYLSMSRIYLLRSKDRTREGRRGGEEEGGDFYLLTSLSKFTLANKKYRLAAPAAGCKKKHKIWIQKLYSRRLFYLKKTVWRRLGRASNRGKIDN